MQHTNSSSHLAHPLPPRQATSTMGSMASADALPSAADAPSGAPGGMVLGSSFATSTAGDAGADLRPRDAMCVDGKASRKTTLSKKSCCVRLFPQNGRNRRLALPSRYGLARGRLRLATRDSPNSAIVRYPTPHHEQGRQPAQCSHHHARSNTAPSASSPPCFRRFFSTYE